MSVIEDIFAEPDATNQPALDREQEKCYKAGENALEWMRKIGKNVVTPAYLLRRLAHSSDAELRMAVADHMNTPLEVLMGLADDTDADVRLALAENHNISPEVLGKLCSDPNPYVVHRAEKTLTRIKCLTLDEALCATWVTAHAAKRAS